MQPKSVGILLTTNLHTFVCFLSHSTFLLLVLLKFLEPNRHFALKVYFDVCDSFVGPSEPWGMPLYFPSIVFG